MKVLGLSSSPRKDGNSRLLAQSILNGAATHGHDTELVDLTDVVRSPLRDCRCCRRADGTCSIDDDYQQLILDKVLPADAIVMATPLYWYGIAGQLKIFIDRIFCYITAAYPHRTEVKQRLVGKRLAIAISSEESYPGAIIGVTAQMQELARYLHWDMVGLLRGIANSHGEVEQDPTKPLLQGTNLGARLFDGHITDYALDTPRSGTIWTTSASNQTTN